jgi:hypothetical protein
LCLEFNCEVDQVPVAKLQEKLKSRGAILSKEEARPWDSLIAGEPQH